MRQDGPEFRQGWRDSFEVEGHRVEILARHATRRRPPTGHEYARQAMRGRPLSMVEETAHEWVALMGNRRATVRQERSGRFGVPHAGLHRDTLRDAVAAWAGRELALARRRPAAVPEGAEPEPKAPGP